MSSNLLDQIIATFADTSREVSATKRGFFKKSAERFKTLSTYWKKQIQMHEYDTYSSFFWVEIFYTSQFSPW